MLNKNLVLDNGNVLFTRRGVNSENGSYFQSTYFGHVKNLLNSQRVLEPAINLRCVLSSRV